MCRSVIRCYARKARWEILVCRSWGCSQFREIGVRSLAKFFRDCGWQPNCFVIGESDSLRRWVFRHGGGVRLGQRFFLVRLCDEAPEGMNIARISDFQGKEQLLKTILRVSYERRKKMLTFIGPQLKRAWKEWKERRRWKAGHAVIKVFDASEDQFREYAKKEGLKLCGHGLAVQRELLDEDELILRAAGVAYREQYERVSSWECEEII